MGRLTRFLALLVAGCLWAGCTARPEEETVADTPPEQIAEEDAADPHGWVLEPESLPPALTEIVVDDSDLDYPVVETTLTNLFSLEMAEINFDQLRLVGDSVVLELPQEAVVFYSLQGEELARIPVDAQGVQASPRHVAIHDWDAGAMRIYDAQGVPLAEVETGEVARTLQQVAVREDGGALAFIANDIDTDAYQLYTAALPEGTPAKLEITGIPQGFHLFYQVAYVVGDSLLQVRATSDNQECLVYVNPDTGETVKTVMVPDPPYDASRPYIRSQVLTSESGLLYTVTGEEPLQITEPAVYGDRLESLFRDPDRGGAALQYWPVSGQGRAGYFPLHNFHLLGGESEDSLLLYYFDSGAHWVARLTLHDRLTSLPEGGPDFSAEALATVCGQRLEGGGSDAFGLISRAVSGYVDLFASTGYLLSAEDPDLADRLVQFVIQNGPGYGVGLFQWLEPYYSGEESLYRIPYAQVRGWVDDTFRLAGLEVDLRASQFYEADTDSFLYYGGGGVGEKDIPYLESAEYKGGQLDLTVVVLPSAYYREWGGRPEPERIRMVVRWDEANGRLAYEDIRLLG